MTQDDLNQNDSVSIVTTEECFGEAPLGSDPSQLVPVLPRSNTHSWKRNIGVGMLAILLLVFVATILTSDPPGNLQTRRPLDPATSPSTAPQSMPTDGVSMSPSAPTDQDVVTSYLKDAKANWGAGEFQQVVEVCNEILAIEPSHERAIYVLALAHAELGNSTLAVKNHFLLQEHNSKLSKQGSDKLVNAYLELIQLGLRGAKEMMGQSQAAKSNLRLGQCVQLCDSGLLFKPSESRLKSLRLEALGWQEACELAMADPSGLINSSLKLRRWSDKTESHTITARLVHVDEKVRLERADGTRAAIKIEQLSVGDQRWLDQLSKRKSEVKLIAK